MEKKKIILKEKKVLEIMNYILENRIVNVRYFISNDLKLNYRIFNTKINLIKENYPDIYLEYEKRYNEIYDEFKEKVKLVMLNILNYKENGVELEDKTFRNFDLFDFYSLKTKYFENLQKKELREIFYELLKDGNKILSNIDYLIFLINSTSGSRIETYEVLDLPISRDAIYKIEDELEINEKEFLISFMNNNKIPFTLGNYNFGKKKMLDQRNNKNDLFTIDILEEKGKKKIK